MDSKLKIKVGDLEIEFEGSEDYIKDGLLKLVAEAVELLGGSRKSGEETSHSSSSSSNQGAATEGGSSQVDMSTSTIASKIGGDSGTDLLLSAAAYLTFVQKKESFSRTDLLQESKNATSYYTQSVSKNLSAYLTRLVKAGKLVQRANDSYAMQSATRTQLLAQLAN
ncbi:hypothetical protein [uncultured Hymenobacter sp.]|uniref:hypothetical protein n=1 Tax=uncultured Hymenobacter sp. TaxID=170016 RepID=UPI0035CC27E8